MKTGRVLGGLLKLVWKNCKKGGNAPKSFSWHRLWKSTSAKTGSKSVYLRVPISGPWRALLPHASLPSPLLFLVHSHVCVHEKKKRKNEGKKERLFKNRQKERNNVWQCLAKLCYVCLLSTNTWIIIFVSYCTTRGAKWRCQTMVGMAKPTLPTYILRMVHSQKRPRYRGSFYCLAQLRKGMMDRRKEDGVRRLKRKLTPRRAHMPVKKIVHGIFRVILRVIT